MQSWFKYADYFVLQHSLLMLVSLAGITFAIIRSNRHPRVSLVIAITLAFYFIEMWTAGLFFDAPPFDISSTTRAYLEFIENFALAAVLVVLTIMAFVGRRRDRAKTATTSDGS